MSDTAFIIPPPPQTPANKFEVHSFILFMNAYIQNNDQ